MTKCFNGKLNYLLMFLSEVLRPLKRKSPCVRTNRRVLCGEETNRLRICKLNYSHGDAAYTMMHDNAGHTCGVVGYWR